MADVRRWNVSLARRLTATGLAATAFFIVCAGAGMGNWGLAVLGIALLALAVSLVVISAVRGGTRAFVRGTAHVLDTTEPPANTPFGRCELQIVVEAPSLAPAKVKIRDTRVPVAKWPDIGDTLPIRVAVDDPRHVRILWDEVRTHGEEAAEEERFNEYVQRIVDAELGGDDADDALSLFRQDPEPIVTDPPPRRRPSPRPRRPAPAEGGAAGAGAGAGTGTATAQDPGATATRTVVDPPRAGLVEAEPDILVPRTSPEETDADTAPRDRFPRSEAMGDEAPGSEVLTGEIVDRRARRTADDPDDLDATVDGRDTFPAGSADDEVPVHDIKPIEGASAVLGVPPQAAEMSAADPDAAAVRDLLAAYPSARPGRGGGAVHGVGVTLIVTELARSIAFYRDMLGFYVIDSGTSSAVLASGDTRIMLRCVADMPRVDRRVVHLNLEVDDVDAVYAELVAKGVKFIHRPRPVARGEHMQLWAAAFRDPDGHGITIIRWLPLP